MNLADVELSQGLKGLGASPFGDPLASRAGGRPDFTKVTLYAARLQSLAPRWSVLAAVNTQYAFNELLSPEEFAYGGEQFGRAYDAAELLGDSGIALQDRPPVHRPHAVADRARGHAVCRSTASASV